MTTVVEQEEIVGPELDYPLTGTVRVSCCGNPDQGQDPGKPLYGVPCTALPFGSLREASALCRKYIEEHDLGGGNWDGGDVYVKGTVVAKVSYNGRVWRRP